MLFRLLADINTWIAINFVAAIITLAFVVADTAQVIWTEELQTEQVPTGALVASR